MFQILVCEETGATIMNGGQGVEPPAARRILQFFAKNSYFNSVFWITFRTFLEPFGTT